MADPRQFSATCPMCGRVNEYAREELVHRRNADWGLDSRPSFFGTCTDCGEPIELNVDLEDLEGNGSTVTAARWEVWAAFIVLLGIGAWFVYSLLSMLK